MRENSDIYISIYLTRSRYLQVGIHKKEELHFENKANGNDEGQHDKVEDIIVEIVYRPVYTVPQSHLKNER